MGVRFHDESVDSVPLTPLRYLLNYRNARRRNSGIRTGKQYFRGSRSRSAVREFQRVVVDDTWERTASVVQ